MAEIKENWRNEYELAILNGNIVAAKEIVLKNAEDIHLLKFFRGTMRNLKTVMAGEFWLSNAKNFNDPYDSLSLANVRSKLVYDRYNPAERKLADEEYTKQVQSNSVAYKVQSSIFVTCFSEVPLSNLHMWSYYADDHKGFCAEYSLKKLLEHGVNILPVVYTKEWKADRTIQDFSTQVALIKGIDWAQEKEWRIVKTDLEQINANGICQSGIMPEAIYVGCRDQLHIDENWKKYYDLANICDDKEELIKYVWESDRHGISLNDVLDLCEQYKPTKMRLFSMTLNESELGLRKREIIY